MSYRIKSYMLFDSNTFCSLSIEDFFLVLVDENGECFDVVLDKGRMFCIDMDDDDSHEVIVK